MAKTTKILRDWWWLILVYAAIAAAFVFFVVANLPPEYKTATKVFVTPTSNAALANIYDAPYTDRAVKTVSLLISSDEAINNIAEYTGVNPKEVKKSYKANYVIGTQLIEIKVSNKSQREAQLIAEAIAPTTTTLLKSIQKDTGEKNQIKISVAEQPSFPAEDKVAKYKTAGIVILALCLLGYVIFYLLGAFTGNISSHSDLEEIGIKYLGKFGYFPGIEKKIESLAQGENQKLAEMLREIRNTMVLDEETHRAKTICITSTQAKEGKSAFIYGLALVLSEEGKRVAIIDANFKSPCLDKLFLADEKRDGLIDFLRGTSGHEEIISKTKFGNIWVIPSGKSTAHKKNYYQPSFNQRLGWLKNWLIQVGGIDYILIDTPALRLTSDAILISKISDGVILINEHNKIKKSEALKTKKTLKSTKAKVLGAVISKAPHKKGAGGAN